MRRPGEAHGTDRGIAARRACAALLLALSLAGCQVDLYTGLTEREANEVIAALGGAGIPAGKSADRNGKVAVLVDRGRFNDAVSLLNTQGLPHQRFESMGDVFKGGGLVTSPTEERARLVYALSQELAKTVAEIDGVLSARIHVVLPETDALDRKLEPSSASVFIRYQSGTPLQPLLPQIKMLVANSIEGLTYDQVSLVAIPVNVPASSAATAPPLRDVAGIWVHCESVARAWLTLGALGGLAALGLGSSAWLLARRRARPAAEDAEAPLEEART